MKIFTRLQKKREKVNSKDLEILMSRQASDSLRSRRDYGNYTDEEIAKMAIRLAKSVNPYLNTPPTKLKRDLKNVKDKSKRKKMNQSLNAWRLTVPGPWRVNAAEKMITIAKILLRR